jgi:battenin
MEQLEIELPSTYKDARKCRPTKPTRTTLSFWIMGLLNNGGYVIMNAGAKDITPCLVGLVYIANVLPSLSIKATLPFWQHRVSYSKRISMATLLMFLSFVVVILGQLASSPVLQLFGVALGSAQSGLGEASLLAMASLYEGSQSRVALTAWSSGTGFAGIFGYAYVILFTVLFQASFSVTLFVGLILPVSFGFVFFKVLDPPTQKLNDAGEGLHRLVGADSLSVENSGDAVVVGGDEVQEDVGNDTVSSSLPKGRKEMAIAIYNLWPYTVPLFTVYFAEYAMQSGTWAAIGFPVTDEASRKEFYKVANFSYQVGVFLSRSSGTVVKSTKKMLWIMPTMQVFLLIFFWTDAAFMYWYDWSLIIPCFFTGCLGGAVYVGAFTLINTEIPKGKLREFSLSAASVADSVGIVFSDVLGMLIQLQLYQMHGLSDGNDLQCGGESSSIHPSNMTNVTITR